MTTDVGRGERAGSAATPGRTRDVIVNSTVAAVLATAVTIFVHELVHLVTGIVLGHGGTLYPFGVIHDGSLTDTETALTAISAPIASLVIGAAVIAALPRPATSRFGQLFLFWLGATSFMEGAGYLVITPMGLSLIHISEPTRPY